MLLKIESYKSLGLWRKLNLSKKEGSQKKSTLILLGFSIGQKNASVFKQEIVNLPS